ncbi:MAG: hypothetical protein NC548_24520 [Lachnospiraceae bacterium]|nr:hypothetical protein [Lachnospiraceae bacterium]
MQAVYPVLFTKTEDCILVEAPDLEVLTEEYRRKIDTKAVRKNVTIPSWLNYEAEHAGINISRVLQEALMKVLNVQRHF